MSNALADLGASISIMPYSLFKRLGLGSLKPIKMTIKMADRSMQSPKGIKENVLVKISNFVFPVDFVVLDIMEDENVSIILGRPMLATAHAKIDVYGKKISLGVGNDQVVFNINKKESPAFISPICVINEVDKTQELNDLVMNDKKVRDFENYLSPEYGSQDIISLSPSELAEDKEEFSMTLGDPDKRMSIGLEEFVDIDDMWDNLDPGILSNEKATTEFLKSGDRIHLHSLDNLQLSCKIGFVSFNPYFVPQTPFNIISRKAYNTIMNHEIMYSGINIVGLAKNLRVFIGNLQFLVDFIILESTIEFVEKGLTEVLFGQPFKEQIGLVEDQGKGTLWFKSVKRRILEENKEPTTTHDKPKQQLQKVVSHEIKESPTHYSVTCQNRLPPKETDPGSFILPCIIGNYSMSNALADLGASISIMPYSLFKILGLGSLKPIKMTIKMADRSMQSPKGIKENVLVKISNFIFPVDFVILDIMEDENVLIILGRPMLATAHAKIDVYSKKISRGVGNDQVVFNINKKESPAFISPICIINEVDKTQELVMNDEKVRHFENYLSTEYGSQDIISLSPSELAEDKKEFNMTLCNLDQRISIGLEEFVDIDDMWDDLDPGILSNEKATTEFLKSGDKIHLQCLDNL
ncbi:homeodomain-like protein [Tanacetum coccineum]